MWQQRSHQAPFQLPSNTKVLVLPTALPKPCRWVRARGHPKSVPCHFLRGSQGKGAALPTSPRTRAPVPGPGEGLLLQSGPDLLTRKENLGWSEPQPSSMPSTTLWTQDNKSVDRQPLQCFMGQDAPLSAEAAEAWSWARGLGPQAKGNTWSLPLGARSFTGDSNLNEVKQQESSEQCMA